MTRASEGYRTGRYGTYGFTYHPDGEGFRGLAIVRDGTGEHNALCNHSHKTATGARACAVKVARRVIAYNEEVSRWARDKVRGGAA